MHEMEIEMTWKGNGNGKSIEKSIDFGPEPNVKREDEKDEKCN